MKKDLEELDKKYLWHPFTQMQDYLLETNLVIEKGEGSFLFDIYGKKYIDAVSSLWVNIHGHNKKEINEALKNQIDQLCHATLLGQSTSTAVLFAEKLIAIAPKNLTKVFYSDNGATANEIAMKMAFQYFRNQEGHDTPSKKRKKYVNLAHAYHGDTLGSVSVGGIDLFHKVFKELIFEPITIKDFSFDHATQIFSQHGDEIAACILEPKIQGAAGMRIQPEGFLKHLRSLCDEVGAFLICDEVATGFGRTGKMFAVEHEGVEPDFLCLAKGITGGYLPLAATLTTEKIYQGFCADYSEYKSFFHGHSYTGNALACSAGIANLEIFQTERTLENLQTRIERVAQYQDKFLSHPHVKEFRQMGFMLGIEMVQNKAQALDYPMEEKKGHRVVLAARKRGAILRPLGNTIVLMPPLNIEIDVLEQLLQIVYESIDEVTSS